MQQTASATVEPREAISVPRFIATLTGMHGAQFVSLRTRTPVGMNKKDNPFAGRVEKISEIRGMVGFNYENSVNALRAREGHPDEFIAGARTWGERIDGTPLVQHKGKHYVEVKVEAVSEPTYLLDGVPVTEEQLAELKPFLPAPKPEQEVTVRTYKVDNVISFNGGGHKFSIQ